MLRDAARMRPVFVASAGSAAFSFVSRCAAPLLFSHHALAWSFRSTGILRRAAGWWHGRVTPIEREKAAPPAR